MSKAKYIPNDESFVSLDVLLSTITPENNNQSIYNESAYDQNDNNHSDYNQSDDDNTVSLNTISLKEIDVIDLTIASINKMMQKYINDAKEIWNITFVSFIDSSDCVTLQKMSSFDLTAFSDFMKTQKPFELMEISRTRLIKRKQYLMTQNISQ